jgi:hypothetical protein
MTEDRNMGNSWRASLEYVQTGELIGFTKLVDLLTYLDSIANPAIISNPYNQRTSRGFPLPLDDNSGRKIR